MTMFSYWPAPGLLVPFPTAVDSPLATSGAQVEPTKYITDLVFANKLYTYNPLGSSVPAPINYFQYALYCTTLQTSIGVFGGQVVETIGYRTRGDGGEGSFYWDATSVTTADNGMVFGNGANGRWIRQVPRSKYVNLRWFGPVADSVTDDSAVIKAALSVFGRNDYGCELYVPPGYYACAHRISVGWDTDSASRVGYNFTMRGSEADGSTLLSSVFVWTGAATEGAYASNLFELGGAGCIIRNIGFQVGYGFHCGVLVNQGRFPGEPLTASSQNKIENCAFIGGKAPFGTSDYGFAFDYYNVSTGNGENCIISRSYFSSHTMGCVVLVGGQCFNTVIENCFMTNAGMNTLGNDYPFGAAVVVQGAFHQVVVRNSSFHRMAAIVYSINVAANVELFFCEGEFNKKYIYHPGFGPGDLATFSMHGGRFANDAVGWTSQAGLAALVFGPADVDAISITGDVSLSLYDVNFTAAPTAQAFRMRVWGDLNSTGCLYPNADPFYRDTYWSPGKLARTFSHGDSSYDGSGNKVSIESLNGFHSPAGTLTFGPAVTAQSVVFTHPENAFTPGSIPLLPAYRVQLTIMSATAGATISQPYVSAFDRLGFTVTLPSAPGGGKTITVAYELTR